jgi:hypothetical protein
MKYSMKTYEGVSGPRLGQFLSKGATLRVQSLQPSTRIFRFADGSFQILVVSVPQTGETIMARRPFIPLGFFMIFLWCYNSVAFAPTDSWVDPR